MAEPNVVGEGTYGCVHKPPMKCKRENVITDPTIASKLMEDEEARNEMMEFKLVEDADTDKLFHLGKPSICKVDNTDSNKKAMTKCTNSSFRPEKIDQYSLLLIKYGGLDLDKYGKKIKEFSMSAVHRRSVENFWLDISRVIYGLKIFNDRGVVHHDVKQQNIVYNEDTGRANFIDFGLMTTKARIQSAITTSSYLFGMLHWSFPPEMQLLNLRTYSKAIRGPQTKLDYFNDCNDILVNNHKYFYNCIIEESAESAKYRDVLQHHLTDFYQMIAQLKQGDYNKFVDACIDTIDIYGAGIALLYVLYRSKRFLEIELYNELKALFLSMVNHNVFLRITPNELVTRYENILLNSGLLEKYNLHFDNHLLAEGRPIPLEVARNIEEDVHRSLSMTPKEQDDFIQSVVITCPDGKEYNSKTKRCNKHCKPGYTRDDKFKCKSKRQTAKRRPVPALEPVQVPVSGHWSRSSRDMPLPRNKSAKKCPPGKELNTKTNRCNKTCKQGYVRNANFKCRKSK
jgi:serine/threonine protein kinase